jgi:hypothetical protein
MPPGDSLELLAELFVLRPVADQLRKLRPAFFIAQSRCDTVVYSFRLSMGRVVSEDLSEDLAQLWANGMIGAGAPRVRRVEIYAKNLSDQLERLFAEDEETLEAAATMLFFARRQLGEPSDRLAWFRQLPEPKKHRAELVASG